MSAATRLPATAALTLALALSATASADDQDVAAVGKERFMDYCAVCHGPDATGGGPFANILNKAPPDLTGLSARNNGDFPFNQVYDMIDGRGMPMAHGTSDMPIWGGEWRQKSKLGSETELRGRLLEMIVYLRSIQK